MNQNHLEFLKAVEGNEYKPYVPPYGRSGVTIGIGVDLGNIDIDRLDLPKELKLKLLPFENVKRNDAKQLLKDIGLKLTKKEVDLVSMAAIKQHMKLLESAYNKDGVIPFSRLTENQKLVLLSVQYQYGNLRRRTPKFWRFATQNDWKSVYYELMNFGDSYATRRQTEAKLILDDFIPL